MITTFKNLHLIEPLLKAVESEGYEIPSPIQAKAVPQALEGKDVLAIAQTGTGKTAAFALPILQLLSAASTPGGPPVVGSRREIRALILTPTRELASQIGDSFDSYGRNLRIRNTVIFGGVGQNPQVKALRDGVDVVVATPGRLLDLIRQRLIRLDRLEIFVLDEADRMLDMGFIHDVRRIIATLPQKRQTLFFSATMPPEIGRLASQILKDPVRVEVTPVASTAERIDQSVYAVQENLKTSLLVKLLADHEVTRALVFTRTKRDANRVAEALDAAGIGAAAIHGNKSQGARERALDSIKSGKTLVLVATDIAARGIDIDGISHVFNYDIPDVPESYVHRIGRTGRAGNAGRAVSFCAPDERSNFMRIEKLIRMKVAFERTPDGLAPETRSRGRRGGSGGGQERRFSGGWGRGPQRQSFSGASASRSPSPRPGSR